MEYVMGIDLGTTNTCVAIVEGGIPKVIANKAGYKTTPSMFAVTDNGKRLIGHLAKRQVITNSSNTVYAAKRLIGRTVRSPEFKQAKVTYPYELVEWENGDIRIRIRDRIYAISEIGSYILQEMRVICEEYLGQPVIKAVITVPAYFNDNQRQATKDAGRIAGFEVLRIINEPTAAALAFGFGKKESQKIAVFDLGGGTFDISILEISDGVFEVLSTGGDTYLGGEDFDMRIIEWLVYEFAREHKVDLRKDKMAFQRLKDAAETAKCELSFIAQTEINLPFIYSEGETTLHLQYTLTREKLESLVIDLVEKSLKICHKAFDESPVKVDELDQVLLVGGMTRMPLVQRKVKEYFRLDPCKGIHPDEAVALGAAIQGFALMKEDSDVLLLDVTPHSLGIMIVGGYFNTIIRANTKVPTSKTHTFTTVRDNQTTVKILVFQGESEMAMENEFLGEFMLTGLREARRGEPQVEVAFEITADGIVRVSAKDLDTGKQQRIEVT
ncbi:MAG: molecular chaperone DnaK, partial [Myxococcales bacterium]|nr:molecular chaperone DnaK [Myxococcales bacterium]